MTTPDNLRAYELEIAVAPDRLDFAGGDPVTGLLAVRFGPIWFPERNWSDFPVVVLGWWAGECATLAEGGNGAFRFMDGPFQFNARNLKDGRAELQSQERRRDGTQTGHGPIAIERLTFAVVRAAEGILGACERREWLSRDVEELRSALKRVRTIESGR